jgi:formylglycine-generating enzyme required for sulfatase activity
LTPRRYVFSRRAALTLGLAACFDVSGVDLLHHQPIAENDAGRYGIQMVPSALAAGQGNAEAPNPGDEFRDCASACPAMIVIPAGRFTMGSLENDADSRADERPRHEVTLESPTAVSKFEATFDEWDACVAAGACPPVPDRWGRGRMPVINVSWNDAKQYAAWLSRVTGKPYRLLTEAEFEYAARAGAVARYASGVGPGEGGANCDGCGSRWDLKQTAPVGSFRPNAFGL